MTPKKTKRCAPIVALGTMTFGGQTNARDAGRMLDMFLDEGHTWVDTAYMYTDGASERILGRLLKERRRKVFLATKAYPDKLGPGKPRGLTAGSVRGQLEGSLKRMKLDCVDLFYLHAPDNRTPLEDTLAACMELRAEGKLRETGLSNYASWQVAEVVGICLRNGWIPPIIYQGMYNAVTRDVERECQPACCRFGLDFIAYNPLAGGFLTGKHTALEKPPKSGRFAGEYYRDRFWKKEYFEALALLQPAVKRSRITLAEAAIRWLMHHSQADSILLGASKVEHLAQNLGACRKKPLSLPVRKAFDRAWEHVRSVCEQYFRDERSARPVLRPRS